MKSRSSRVLHHATWHDLAKGVMWCLATGLVIGPFACGTDAEVDDGPRSELKGEVSGVGGFGPYPAISAMSAGGAGGATNSVQVASGTGGGNCPDPLEPNESELQAINVANIGDCDSDGKVLEGILVDGNDVDWFRYQGADEFGCVVDPARSLTVSSGVRICKYAQCKDDSVAAVDCKDGSTPDTSPDGLPGCCSTSSFATDIDCDATSDDASIYLRIDSATNACVVYSIAFHY